MAEMQMGGSVFLAFDDTESEQRMLSGCSTPNECNLIRSVVESPARSLPGFYEQPDDTDEQQQQLAGDNISNPDDIDNFDDAVMYYDQHHQQQIDENDEQPAQIYVPPDDMVHQQQQHFAGDYNNNPVQIYVQPDYTPTGCSTPNECNVIESLVGSPAKPLPGFSQLTHTNTRVEMPTKKATDEDVPDEVTDRLNHVSDFLTSILNAEMDSPKEERDLPNEEVALPWEEAPFIDRFLFDTVPVDIDAAALDHENLLFDYEESAVDEVMDETTIKEKEMWAKLAKHLERKYAVICPVEDSGRIEVPDNDSVILARVMDMSGRHATVVPAAIFENISTMAKEFVTRFNLSPLPRDFNNRACVLVEQDSCVSGEYDYCRGWVFASNNVGVFVMLMDERRIVNVPRTCLYKCPDEIVKYAPPLAVAAEFDREMTGKELSWLVQGCTAQCRVMKEKEEDEALKLHLVKIETEGRALDPYFCSAECTGDCDYCAEQQ